MTQEQNNLTDQVLELFVPAKALEHPVNGEKYTLSDKLCAALHRYSLKGNFNEVVPLDDTIPFIFLKHYELDKQNLGYNVWYKKRA